MIRITASFVLQEDCPESVDHLLSHLELLGCLGVEMETEDDTVTEELEDAIFA